MVLDVVVTVEMTEKWLRRGANQRAKSGAVSLPSR